MTMFPIRDLTDQERSLLKARQKKIFRDGLPAIRRAPAARRARNEAERRLAWQSMTELQRARHLQQAIRNAFNW